MGLSRPIPDFVGVSDFKEIQERFKDAAQSLLVDFEIVRATHRWRITALELYLFTEGSNVWRDPNTHRNPEQSNSGTWYVHRRPMNRSGLDITAGDIRCGIYAGLLIREIDLIDGPAKSLKTLIREKSSKTGCASVSHDAACLLLREVQTDQRLEAISAFDSSKGMAALAS